nr:glycosyltransferase family A protein [uncultured Flavobacterium sp.]
MLVSIIIPVHKTANFFKMCLESCLAQTYKEIEIIIACNGGLSIRECKDFLNIDDARIIYLETKNGRHNARNEALSVAGGTFVQFLDYDDFLFANKFSAQINLIKENFNNQVSISKWKKFRTNVNEDYTFPFDLMFEEGNLSAGRLIEKLGQSGGFIATASWIVSRDLLTGIEWIDSPNDDAVFFSEICKKNPNVMMVPQVLAGCRIHDDNTSAIRSQQQFDLLLKGWSHISNNLKAIRGFQTNLYLYESYLYLISYSQSIKRYRLLEVICKSVFYGLKSGLGFNVIRDLRKKILK